jgi:hypothetical protein
MVKLAYIVLYLLVKTNYHTMKKGSAALLSTFVLLLSVIACKKAGTGGKVEVACFPQHHGKAIKGATVYVKFNTLESPGSELASYDLVVPGEPNEDHVHVEELRKGNYYFYTVGYDSSIAEPVYGGVPLKIKDKSGEIDLEIPVTE